MFDRAIARIALLAALAGCVGIAAPRAAASSAPTAALECANARLPVSILDGVPAHSGGSALKTVVVRAPKASLHLAVAATEKNREIGLMCVVRMRPRTGMIFEFGKDVNQEFWMKNTLIPLDLLFIAPDGRIIRIAASAKPQSEATIDSMGIVRGVLEVAGGTSERLGIKAGDRVHHPAFGRR
jgi:uncharacterized membrane protein (UPF0127 family)